MFAHASSTNQSDAGDARHSVSGDCRWKASNPSISRYGRAGNRVQEEIPDGYLLAEACKLSLLDSCGSPRGIRNGGNV